MRRETFKTLADGSEFSILVTDAEIDWPGPRIVYVNNTFEKITGYRREEVLGQTPRILQGADTDRNTLDEVRKSLTEGIRFSGTCVNYKKDGSPFVMNWSVEPINLDGQKHFMAVQSNVIDSVASTLEKIKSIQLHTLEQLVPHMRNGINISI